MCLEMLGLEPRLGVNWGFPSTQWPAAPYWVWGWFSNCWSSNPDFGSVVAPFPLPSCTPHLSALVLPLQREAVPAHMLLWAWCLCLSQLLSPCGCDICDPGLELCSKTSRKGQHTEFRLEQMLWLSQNISQHPHQFQSTLSSLFWE